MKDKFNEKELSSSLKETGNPENVDKPEDVNEQIKDEVRKLKDNAESLQNEFKEFKNEKEFQEVLENNPEVKKGFLDKFGTVLVLLGSVAVAGILMTQLPELMGKIKEFHDNPERMAYAVMTTTAILTSVVSAIGLYMMEGRKIAD